MIFSEYKVAQGNTIFFSSKRKRRFGSQIAAVHSESLLCRRLGSGASSDLAQTKTRYQPGFLLSVALHWPLSRHQIQMVMVDSFPSILSWIIGLETHRMHPYLNSEYADLQAAAEQHRKTYAEAAPFPSIYFRNFFRPEVLDTVLEEFPDLEKLKEARKYNNAQEKKLMGEGESVLGAKTRQFIHYLNSEPFLKFLQVLTGIDETLLGDPYLWGGGLHQIKRGGLLKVHADFNKHPYTNLDRRLNILIYLNKDWDEAYGGHLELWDKEMKHCVNKIPPFYNTLAIFSTTDFSYHGHPDPLNCPEDRSRQSLALYYYSNGRPQSEINPNLSEHTTLFQARKGNEEDRKAFSLLNTIKPKQLAIDLTPPIILKGIRAVFPKKH